MVLLNKVSLFLKRQVTQIHGEGMVAFSRKIKKLWKFLYLNLLAELAVTLKIDWAEAHNFVGDKLLKKYKKIDSQSSNVDIAIMDKIEKKAIFCLEKYVAHEPRLSEVRSWVKDYRKLALLFLSQGSSEEYMNIAHRVEVSRRDIIKKHQLETLGIEFIPRAFAVGCIGVYDNLEAYVKAGILGLRPFKKLILLLDSKAKINNPCYLNYWRKYITVISDPLLVKLLTPLEDSLTVLIDFSVSFYERPLTCFRAIAEVREQWINEDRPPLLILSKEDEERGWDCLGALGVPKDAWFVCLHVKETGWNEHGSTEDYRNADISTYSLAIKAVVDAGGWVIRMGDPSMTPLPEMPHVIDYAHSDAKSDWMDIFLSAKCRFSIGTSSGFFNVGQAFGVPAVLTNFLPTHAIYYLSRRNIFLPRLCWSKNENHTLSFSELFSPPFSMSLTQRNYDRKGLTVIENTPEEIRGAVEEMLERFNGTLQYNEEDSELQERFRAMTETCGKLYRDHNVVVHARIGRDFLRKHASLLPSERELLEVK